MVAETPAGGSPDQATPARVRRAGWLAMVALLASFAGGPGAAAAQDADSRRALHVEAAYLVNFLRYCDWSGRLEASDAPLVITVIGDEEIAPAVASVAAAAGPVQERPVEVRAVGQRWWRADRDSERYLEAVRQLRASHVVFIDRSAAGSVAPALDALRGQPVLTVANAGRFVERGGMLELFPLGRNIVFAANPHAIQEAGVMLSAKVLKLARSLEEEAP